MAKSGISIELSNKDKKLLFLLLIVLIVAAAYFFGYSKLSERVEEQKKEYKQLKKVENDLLDKEADMEDYAARINVYESTYADIMSGYDSGVTQTSQIDFLNKVERVTNAWIKSVAFSSPAPIYTFGRLSSSNPEYGTGQLAYNTDMVGYRTELSMTYEAEYEDWKKLLEFINGYFSKNTIENISMTYNNVSGLVNGSFALSIYSVVGSDSKYEEPQFNVDTGTENIFESEYISTEDNQDVTGDDVLANYDYYLAINPFTSAKDTYTMGSRDASKEELLTMKVNEAQNVAITVTGSEGKYVVRYQIGDKTTEQEFNKKESIEFLVLSNLRTDENDDVEVTITIDNSSDTEVKLKVNNDDSTDPRVKITGTTGQVTIYQ